MNKLELKHIVGYLPYGLKMTRNGKNFGILYALYNKYNKAEINFEFGNDRYDIEDLKPALRPMSDLHKEIEGVVHIVEMARMAASNIVHIDEVMSQAWRDGFWKVDGRDKDEMLITFGFGNREFWLSDKGNMVLIDNLKLYEYLYQHHFDIHNLIEQGLAIDINTL